MSEPKICGACGLPYGPQGGGRIHNCIEALKAEVARLQPRKLAPVQGYAAGIPWDMHLRAYDAYCKKYGRQQALVEGNCRGGFGDKELDHFIPGWREELSELARLRAALERIKGGATWPDSARIAREALEGKSP